MDDKIWIKVIRNIQKSGGFSFPINDLLMELTKTLLREEEAKFLLNFKRPSLNINQIKGKTDLNDDSLNKMLNQLMDKGLIVGVPSRSTGTMVYHLNSYLPGIFEFTFMKGGISEKEKNLALIFEKLHNELTDITQKNYDIIVEQYRKIPFMDRVIPVEEKIELQPESVLPFEEISKLIEENQDIAISNCYCRHHKELLDEPCKINAPKLTCMHLGKFAVFTSTHGFAKTITKEEAIKILNETEEAGLVHKAIPVGLNPENREAAICNCCKCCCDTLQMYYRGTMPLKTLTSYIANVDGDLCTGCGVCVEKCPVESPQLVDDISVLNDNRCIGCGVCAYHCPEEAIKLERTGPRVVFLPPPKLEQIKNC
jgi:ferredoxin